MSLSTLFQDLKLFPGHMDAGPPGTHGASTTTSTSTLVKLTFWFSSQLVCSSQHWYQHGHMASGSYHSWFKSWSHDWWPADVYWSCSLHQEHQAVPGPASPAVGTSMVTSSILICPEWVRWCLQMVHNMRVNLVFNQAKQVHVPLLRSCCLVLHTWASSGRHPQYSHTSFCRLVEMFQVLEHHRDSTC